MSPRFARFYFLMQGIGSLIAWNGILTGLSFFNDYFPNGEVDFTFPLAQLIPLPFTSFLSIYLERVWHINTRIAWFTAIMGLATLFLPIIAVLLQDTVMGLWLSYACCFSVGIFNAIQQTAVIGLAGYFPGDCMAMFATGFGIAGLIENALRAICLLVFPDSDQGNIDGIIVYYAITVLILIICIFLHCKFIKTSYAIKEIALHKKDHGVYDNKIEDDDPVSPNEEEVDKEKKDLNGLSVSFLADAPEIISHGIISTFWGTFKDMKLYAILIFFEYIQTLMLFPGVMLLVSVPGMNSNWENVTMVTCFNLFDTIGRYLGKYREYYSKSIIAVLVTFRFIFFFTFIIQVTDSSMLFFGQTWFCFINIALFGLTNGLSNSALFVLGPESMNGPKKEVAGFIMITFLNFGMLVGSTLSLTLENL